MKDEEVGGEWGAGPGWVGGVGRSQAGLGGQAPPTAHSHRPLPLLPRPQLRRMQEMLQKMKQQMQDRDPAAAPRAITILPASGLALPTPGPRRAWTRRRIHLDRP